MTIDKPRETAYGQNGYSSPVEKLTAVLRFQAARRLLALMQSRKPAFTVLELGCGYNAGHLFDLQRLFPAARFTGVDLKINPRLNGSIGMDLIEGDLNDWMPDHTYDAVLSLAVAEHLADQPRHFALLARSLKDDGIAMLTTPTPAAHFFLCFLSTFHLLDRNEIRDHKIYLTKEGIDHLAYKSGLHLRDYRLAALGMNHHIVFEKKQPDG